MGKKSSGIHLPPGVLDELITRIETVERQVKALEDAARAFAVVYSIPRIPDPPDPKASGNVDG